MRPLPASWLDEPMAGDGPSDRVGFSLPVGTVTFLLTDVEASTSTWESAPDAMGRAVPRHYYLLDEAITSHGGVRPVEQGEGDSVVGAFSRASDAVAAALDAQRAFAAERWPDGASMRVRMAIHTGEAQLRDEGNYFGQTVIRCARLRAIGHGGQVLLSDVTASLVRDRLPDGAGLSDLGTHRLKDLGRPERVWQLRHLDLQPSFPGLRSLDAFRHNLPAQLTPLIGRQEDIDGIGQLLGPERLVTLTGSGGVGKTRLALACAAESVDHFPGGVWLVELAGVKDDEGVAAASLAALGVHQIGGAPLIDQLAREFTAEAALLVLDNCEHLADGCARLVAELLASDGGVTVLATSREPLRVPGEVIWQVPSLDTPPREEVLTVSVLSQYDAVRLFADRARRARPSFSVSKLNAPAIAQICSSLDGIPLALELAAARCRQMTPEQIVQELDDRFRLLTAGARTVMPRLQTLEASIDWSYDRLDESEQMVFRRLGMFAGPFPLEAAEAVVAAFGDVDEALVFDVLTRLVDKSLVGVDEVPGGAGRYRLLETLRAYGLGRARAAHELAELRRAHALWWLKWLDARWRVLHTDPVVDEIEHLHDNLKAALDWSLDEPELGLRLLRRLARAWQNSGRPGDAMVAVDRLLTDENAERYGLEWAKAANAVAVLVSTARGYFEALPLLKTAERIATSAGDSFHMALARWLCSFTEETSVAVRDLARQQGDAYVEALATMTVAQNKVDADPAAAAVLLDSAELGAASRESSYLRNFADRNRSVAALSTGDVDRSVELARELASSRSTLMVGNAVQVLIGAGVLGADEATLTWALEIAERRSLNVPAEAGRALRPDRYLSLIRGGPAFVESSLRPDYSQLVPLQLYIMGRVAIEAGAGELATATARALAKPAPHHQAVLAAIEATAAGSEDRWYDALGIATEHGLRLIAVDALEGLAVGAARSDNWAECLRLSTAAERLRQETNYRFRLRSEQEALDAATTSARDSLGRIAAQEVSTAGALLDWREAAAYALRTRGDRRRPRRGWESLTPTEVQVVALAVDGLTNRQIAARLLMGPETVKTHLSSVYDKLGVRTRTGLAKHVPRGERRDSMR